MLHVRLTAVVEVFAWSLWLSALLQQPWSCHRYCIHGRARVVVVAIVAAVREALSTTNTPCFPAEGAAGLASNSQAWLREPRLQSPRHCRAEAQLRWCADPRCPQREGPTKGTCKHAWLPRRDPDEGMRRHQREGTEGVTDPWLPQGCPSEVEGGPNQASQETRCRCQDHGRSHHRRVVILSQSVVVVVMVVAVDM
jgi:hypothetical protein